MTNIIDFPTKRPEEPTLAPEIALAVIALEQMLLHVIATVMACEDDDDKEYMDAEAMLNGVVQTLWSLGIHPDNSQAVVVLVEYLQSCGMNVSIEGDDDDTVH